MSTDDVWPLTVVRARYGGAYEGAEYVAFRDHPGRLAGVHGDDLTCAYFFDTYEEHTGSPIGRGDTPQAACEDLVWRLDTGGGWVGG